MHVRNFYWLTSYAIEICWGLGFIFDKVICVYLCTFLEKFLLLQEVRCGIVLVFKISDVAWK